MVAEDAESSSHNTLTDTRKRENKLVDAARVRHYKSEPLLSAREAVVSTIRRNLGVGRLHAFKVIASISPDDTRSLRFLVISRYIILGIAKC